jgi:two-component system sensor histidine kinase TtrS
VPLASRVSSNGDSVGGVIVASVHSGIRTAAELRGKRVGALGAESAAAFLFQVNHLMDHGIDPRTDFAAFIRCPGQADCLRSVAQGAVDACFVRTGVLETMAEQGEVSLNAFSIVDARSAPGFELAHSTELYPSWYVLASNKVDTATRERLRGALFAITRDDPAAASSNTCGFVEPRDMGPTREAIQRVFAAGYADLP